MEHSNQAQTQVCPLPIGTLLKNDYRIGSVLAKGSFSWVYLAYQKSTKRKVVIKEYAPSSYALRCTKSAWVKPLSSYLKEFEAGLEIFFEEIKSMHLLRSKSIANFLDAFIWQDNAYMTMSYQDGNTLDQEITTRLKHRSHPSKDIFTLTQVLEIAIAIAPLMRQIHALGWLHLDLKPANIYLPKRGGAILLDLGSASQKIKNPALHHLIYTPSFAPPEIFKNQAENVGPWSDIYSFGTCLYQMMTGMVPKPAKNRSNQDDTEANLARFHETPRTEISKLILNMMSLDITSRPGSFFAVEQALLNLVKVEKTREDSIQKAITNYLSSYVLVGNRLC